MTALTLWDDPPAAPPRPAPRPVKAPAAPSVPYQPHSQTSRRAAEKVAKSGKVIEDQNRILAYLLRHGPTTDDGLQDGIPMEGNSERPRRRELEKNLGYIEADDVKGLTRLGNAAVRWRLTEEGRKALEGRAG